MNEIKISVIVPIHGIASYLKKCLESLLNQDFQEKYEVLCLNDTPNDDCPKIIDEFVEKYPSIFTRIDVFNGNVSKTRNDGLLRAKGYYIAFVDGDDFVAKNYLSSFYYAAINKKADVVISNYYVFKNNKKHKVMQTCILYNGYISSKKAIQLLLNDLLIRGYVWNKFFKKEVIKDLYFLDVHKIIEDGQFSFDAFFKASKIYWMQKRTYFYNDHGDSESHNWDYKKYIQLGLNLLAYVKFYTLKSFSSSDFKIKYNVSCFIRKLTFLYYIIISKENLKIKGYIYRNLKKQLKLIKKHVVYKNTPWEKVIIEAKLDGIKEDIEINPEVYQIFDMLNQNEINKIVKYIKKNKK